TPLGHSTVQRDKVSVEGRLSCFSAHCQLRDGFGSTRNNSLFGESRLSPPLKPHKTGAHGPDRPKIRRNLGRNARKNPLGRLSNRRREGRRERPRGRRFCHGA